MHPNPNEGSLMKGELNNWMKVALGGALWLQENSHVRHKQLKPAHLHPQQNN